MGGTQAAVLVFGGRLAVEGKADPLRADAGKGCCFGEGVTNRERANAASGLTHGYPPGFEIQVVKLSWTETLRRVGLGITREPIASERATIQAVPRS